VILRFLVTHGGHLIRAVYRRLGWNRRNESQIRGNSERVKSTEREILPHILTTVQELLQRLDLPVRALRHW
jgi:hypothetical protein